MFRSLHMKLVLIMVLLIVSLMTVVGAFLINSVVGFYLEDFYTQMKTVIEDPQFVRDVRQTVEGEGADQASGAERINQVMTFYAGALGIDSRNRNYYILDGESGAYLAGSDDAAGPLLQFTPNLTAALRGQTGNKSDVSASYMDLAIPVARGDAQYIIYVYDNRQTVEKLNYEVFGLILQALVFGLITSILLSFLLAKTMITPIEHLTEGAKRMAAGDFSRRIEVGSRDEIGVLTTNFNSMARQLRETLAQVENERNKLGTLFLHMTDGVVAFSPAGEVIHANPAAAEMLGRAIDPSVSYGDLFGDVASIYEVLAVQQPGYLAGEMTAGRRDLELLLAPFFGESQGGVLVVIHDVTAQRKTEEVRREFIANVSHELRTPLTNIRSYAETLDSAGEQMPAEMQRSFLGVILNESDRMTRIVQDLLTLSRFDSDRGEFRFAPFSFGSALREIYQAVRLEAERHEHTLTLQMPETLPEIVGDKERILQVMMNVVSNAIKYTPDGGVIEITAGAEGGRVWMEVADNGMGIPDEDRSRIFERFYRVDKARSRESGGTGLGLSIAKEIVDRHGGAIFLVDKASRGLTIRVELCVEGSQHGR